MKKNDVNEYIKRYTERFLEFGYSPETLGWGKNGKQNIRFSVLANDAIKENASVLDIGCGFADLYSFMREKSWKGNYHGIDIVPVLINKAKEHYPNIKLENKDFSNDHLNKSDYVIASGIFNAKLNEELNEQYIEKSLVRMFELCNKAVCVDFMSTYVDFKKLGAWHTSPEWAFSIAKKISKRVVLRSDYMPYEFTLIIYKDDLIENSVFKAY